jgi:hypothetical protein
MKQTRRAGHGYEQEFDVLSQAVSDKGFGIHASRTRSSNGTDHASVSKGCHR